MVVDNRPGAGGAVGAELAAKATPDGYTIWIAGIETLNRALVSALNSPDVQNKLTSEGCEVIPTTPAEAVAFMRAQVEKWARLLKEANIPVE